MAAACTLNATRAQQWFPHTETQRLLHAVAPDQIQPPGVPRTYSYDGLLVNLGTVLLQLCEPFTAPNSPHAAKIDATFLFSSHRLQFVKDETRLAASADEVAYFLDPNNAELRGKHLAALVDEGREPANDDAEPLVVSARCLLIRKAARGTPTTRVRSSSRTFTVPAYMPRPTRTASAQSPSTFFSA